MEWTVTVGRTSEEEVKRSERKIDRQDDTTLAQTRQKKVHRANWNTGWTT
jgi:hypothetical protein